MPEELDELFEESELRDLAETISRAGRVRVDADPAFRSELRRTLMREAYDRRRQPAPPIWRRLFSPPGFAWAGAALGLLLIAGVAVNLVANPSGRTTTVLIGCNCTSAQAMSLVQPIELSFSQPMDQQSVEKAISISPATNVNYEWTSTTTVKITPVAGDLAPNTQYQVRIASAASTAAGQQIGKDQKITFLTQPPPSPAPTPTPSATPSPQPPIGIERQLAALGQPAWYAWSADGTVLYLIAPGGSLESVPAAGGQPKALVADGVVAASLSPDGSLIGFYRAGKLQTLELASGRQTDVAGLDSAPAALGWQAGKLLWAADGGVYSQAAPASKLAALPGAVSVVFSPAGDRLAYQGAGHGLTVRDLATGKESQVAASASGFLWSPDGRRLAYADSNGLQATDGSSAPVVLSSQLTSAAGAAWTVRDQLLVPSGGALDAVRADGTGFEELAPSGYGGVEAAPDGLTIAFARGGSAWSAQLSQAVAPPLPSVSPDAASKLLNDFMAARLSTADPAQYLDANGKTSYGTPPLSLRYATDPKLSRWFVIYSEPVSGLKPGVRYTIRLVFSSSGAETAFAGETVLVQKQPDGGLLIDTANGTGERPAAPGPEVISVQASAGQLKVGFDSDLDPTSVTGSFTVVDSSGQPVAAVPTYDPVSRTVTLTGAFTPGSRYRFQVNGVRDVAGHALPAAFELLFTAR